MRIGEMAVGDFLDALAARQPTPGGGGAAALVGSQSASLLSMVVNVTRGSDKYAAQKDDLAAYLAQTERLRAALLALADRDVEAFDAVVLGYELPRATAEEKATRTAYIQAALQGAVEVPFGTAERCLDVMRLVQPLARNISSSVVSDAATALYLAYSGVPGAVVTVNVNLKFIRDTAFVATWAARRDNLTCQAEIVYSRARDVYAEVLGFAL